MAGSDDESELFTFLVTSAARDGAKTTAVGRGRPPRRSRDDRRSGRLQRGRHEGRRLDDSGGGVCHKSEGGREGRRDDDGRSKGRRHDRHPWR